MPEYNYSVGQSLPKAVAEFLRYLGSSAEYSPSTVRAYGIDLHQFAAYIVPCFPKLSLPDITPAIVQRFRESIAHLKPTTVSRKLAALSTFFNWLWLRGEVSANPVAALKRPRKRPDETTWVTAEDAVALMAACRGDRERAILATYMRAALRYTELIRLRLADIDLLRDEMHVVGKGNLRRTVPILSDLRPYIVRWLAVRPDRDHNYLFTTRTGGPLYDKACWRLFRRLLKRAGLEHKGYTVHSLRHGAATQMYEAGVDLATIARFLRHSDTSTVGRYVHATTQAVRREVEAKMASSGHPLVVQQALAEQESLGIVVREAVVEALLQLGIVPGQPPARSGT
jgi:site-specific recombinase XerD